MTFERSGARSVRINLLSGRLAPYRGRQAAKATDTVSPSPDGKLRMTCPGKGVPSSVALLDRNGKKMGQIKSVFEAWWSPDSRYVACIVTNKHKPNDAPEYVTSYTGKLQVYDSNGMRLRLSTGVLVQSAEFSSDSRKIAFLDVERDEFGDLRRFVLKVADIESRHIKTVARNRRGMMFVWGGSSHLAVAAEDKYAVTGLSLVDVATGKPTTLTSDRKSLHVTPLACVPSIRLIAFGAYTERQGQWGLWSVRPGGKPVRLLPAAREVRNAKR